ncbi:hypothetical protein ACQKLP_06230 [Chitinophaga sp. NPDC101104]|uniref:hypothetical protein n=1 Tax=Chitinophaga sp. NPDC101104 TaxID=3390561 RepID=UPI003CFDA5CE
MNRSFCCIGFQLKFFDLFFRYITAKLMIMFAEKIEVPGLRPGPALRKRRLTNLLSRIKIEMFGVESLRPEFVEGKDVRALNTRLVEELMRRMLSQRYALIEKVYQPRSGELKFYILMKKDCYEWTLCLYDILLDYELLDIAERYPVWFEFVKPCGRETLESSNWHLFYNRHDEATYPAGKAQHSAA